jgi:ATP-binding cassette subfamily B protein
VSARIHEEASASAYEGIRAVRREAVAWSVAMTGVQLAIILILGLGAWRVSQGDLSVSALIAFLLYAFGLSGPIMELSANTTAVQKGIAAAGRIRELDAIALEPDRPAITTPAETPSPSPAIIELRDVSAAYGPDSAPAVEGITLAIPRRGHLAIVGPSGAGKTTLLSLLLRFLEPQTGELLLDGIPYGYYTHSQIRERLAYVEQDTPIVPGTIGENLRFSHPRASDTELARVLKDVRLDDQERAITDRLDEQLTPTSVSGGQRQRIALARALLSQPDVLLLDEATAQLDALTEASIHACINLQAQRASVVTIAHRLSTVIDADQIVVMEAGRIRNQGTHAELLASDILYRRLVEALRIQSDRPADDQQLAAVD